MEGYIMELLKSTSADDRKLGIVLAAKTNQNIEEFNEWYATTPFKDSMRDAMKDTILEWTNLNTITPCRCIHPSGRRGYKFITEWKNL